MSGPSSEMESVKDKMSTGDTVQSEAVQALRKYLLRKMSSEEIPSEKDVECIITEGVISITESHGSKLYCSLVQRSDEDDRDQSTQGNKKHLTKHKSLDLDDSTTLVPSELRYLRTDLCIPVLWSKCSFCGLFFESEEELRKHLRDFHFQYFSNYEQLRPLTSTKSLSDLPFSSALKIRDSPPPPPSNPPNSLSSLLSEIQGSKQFHTSQFGSKRKKPVACELCGKGFSTKWNCKKHLEGQHAKDLSINDGCFPMNTNATITSNYTASSSSKSSVSTPSP